MSEETTVTLVDRQTPSCYDILDLCDLRPHKSAIGPAEIKQAYRRALLFNHPDKFRSADLVHGNRARYTIDEVSRAYHTLIDPVRRLEHDRHLQQEPRSKHDKHHGQSHSGIDTLDLDELSWESPRGEWYCACRCGDNKGFTVTETELQANSLLGEIITECRGCSLRLRVTFATVDDGF